VAKFYTKVTYDQPAEVTVRNWRTIMRESYADEGRYFMAVIFRRHFEGGAAQRYGYQHRTPKYLQWKQRQAALGLAVGGGRIENLLTGKLRTQLRETAQIRGFPTRVRITSDTPDYAPPRPRSSKQPDKIGEIYTILPSEGAELGAVLHEGVASRIARFARKKTVTV
jgi:hypothetical protein